MKIRPMGVEFFNADGWTDMSKLIVAFHDFVKSAKKRWGRFVYSRKLVRVLIIYK